MKVSIITMHCPLNYGAVLQTYALQTYLEKYGSNVEIIDYRPHYIVYDQDLTYVPENFGGKFQLLYKLLYIIVKAPHKIYRKRIFNSFIRKYLHIGTPKYTSYKELTIDPPQSERFICGSDQIWSINNDTYKDPAFFLRFIDNPDICFSYAPSGKIPNPLPKEMREISVPLINRLGRISVRESSSAEALQKFVDKPISVVCDPVFLLDAKEWMTLICKKTSKAKYILVYNMGEMYRVQEVAQRLSKLHGLKIYLITSSQRTYSWADKIIVPSIENFIGYIYNAEYVVTNSFHGTAFSIIFKKKFYVCFTNTANERILSIINTLNISDALIETSGANLVDWTYNEAGLDNLNSLINLSKEYIKKGILE